MKKYLFSLASLLLLTNTYLSAPVHAQMPPIVPAIGLIKIIAAQSAATKAANEEMAAKTTTTATYRGQNFLVKRTPDDVLTGDAADRITQLEAQLALCHTALFADSTSSTCPPKQQTVIRAAIKYIDLARPNWDQKAYHQEFKFYLTEDKRRRLAAK